MILYCISTTTASFVIIADLVLPPIPVVELGPRVILSKGTERGSSFLFVIVLAHHKGLLQMVIFRKETFHSIFSAEV